MDDIEQQVSESIAADPNYPLGETDAMKWAVAWRQIRDRNQIDANASQAGGDIDGWMVGWFANAMASAHPNNIMQRAGYIVAEHPIALVPARDDMPAYIGLKVINARPMTRGEYVSFRGWELPADEDAADDGYLVEYTDKLDGNVAGFAGYVTWSPADVFERAYRPLA